MGMRLNLYDPGMFFYSRYKPDICLEIRFKIPILDRAPERVV
jgi:hypothetical protein